MNDERMNEVVNMQVAKSAACSDSISLRKQSLELAGMQLASSPHTESLFDTAMAIIKAGQAA